MASGSRTVSARGRAQKTKEGAPAPVIRDTAIIAIVAIVACIAGLHNELTHDDVAIIHDSTRLQDFTQWKDILTLPYWPPPASPDLYRPVLSFLLALQNVAGGG